MKPNKDQKKDIMYLLRKIVIARDGEACLKCGKTMSLHLSHIYPKGRYKAMELEPDNVKLLCNACHLYWWHKNPIEAHEWLASAIPRDRLVRLKSMSLDNTKRPFDPKLHIIFLLNELTRYANTRT